MGFDGARPRFGEVLPDVFGIGAVGESDGGFEMFVFEGDAVGESVAG